MAGSCGLFDGNGSVVFPLANQVTLITPSQNGNALATCFADVANPTGRAIRYDSENNPIGVPIPCFILDPAGPPIVTYFVFETISASGRASVLCVAKRVT